MKRFIFFICTLVTIQGPVFAKKNNDGNQPHSYLTARIHRGFSIPHHSNMVYIINDYTSGLELTYGRSLFGTSNWEKFFNYPEIGLGFFYTSLGNNQIYGKGFSVFPYVNYYWLRSPRFSIQNKVSMGLGYATKPFDINTNSYNTIFGSHFNVYVGFGCMFDYRVSKEVSVSLSGNLNHLSNGAAKKPNHGVNVLSTSLGVKYHFNKQLTPRIQKVKAPASNAREINIIGSIGRSQGTMVNSEKYWNASVSLNHLWYLSEKRAIGLGLDNFYFPAASNVWIAYSDKQVNKHYSGLDYWASGIFASYNAFLGKTTLFMNIGYYIRTGVESPQKLYPRMGIRYNLTPRLIANFSVKASFFKSEFLEFGLGYRWKYKK